MINTFVNKMLMMRIYIIFIRKLNLDIVQIVNVSNNEFPNNNILIKKNIPSILTIQVQTILSR